jgi:hypothetical protein
MSIEIPRLLEVTFDLSRNGIGKLSHLLHGGVLEHRHQLEKKNFVAR